MVIASERPGVYSDYTASEILRRNSNGKVIGIVSSEATGEKNKIYEMSKLSDVKSIFGDNCVMYDLCDFAFRNNAYLIKTVSCGENATLDDYKSSFNVLSTQDDIYVMICDSQDEQVLLALKQSILNSSENSKERIGIAAVARDDATSFSEKLNCERMMVVCQTPLDSDGTELDINVLSAALAGKIVDSSDPSASFNGLCINGVYGLSDNLSEDDIDDLLSSGVTVFEKTAGGVEIVRAVTSRTKTSGVADRTFHDINTVLIIDDVIPSIRNVLKNQLNGSHNNSKTLSAISTQTTIELENKLMLGIIDSYKQPFVYISQEDSSACIVEIEFVAARGLNQILITANIKV